MAERQLFRAGTEPNAARAAQKARRELCKEEITRMEPADREGTCHCGLEKGTICPTHVTGNTLHATPPPTHSIRLLAGLTAPNPTGGRHSGFSCGADQGSRGRRCHRAGTAPWFAEHQRIICSSTSTTLRLTQAHCRPPGHSCPSPEASPHTLLPKQKQSQKPFLRKPKVSPHHQPSGFRHPSLQKP